MRTSNKLTSSVSWLMIHARFGSFGLGTDFRGAESVWFWPVV
jgi:hypothetical protein